MNGLRNYGSQLRRFGPNARLYLLYSFASGFSLGILRLLFNFYVLSLGEGRAFLGLLVALPPIVITVAAIPTGMIGQRLGFRSTLLLGAVAMVGSLVGISLSTGAIALVAFSILRGLSRTILQVTNAPFMAENSGETERTHLFSVQFATRTMSSFFGFLLAGVLPTLFSRILSVGAEDPLAYRSSLFVAAGIFAVSIVPLLRVARPESGSPQAPRPRISEMFRPPGPLLKLFFPQVLIGFGAGALVPFLNIFLRTRFGLSDAYVGMLFAFQSLVMAGATLLGPIIAERFSRIGAVIAVQLLSIPFLIALGYVPILTVASIGFLARASLMNMANPLYTAFAMDAVSAEKRPTASALMQMSWQGTRGLSALASGQIQEGYGFGPLFPITIGTYLLATGLIWRFFGRRGTSVASGDDPAYDRSE